LQLSKVGLSTIMHQHSKNLTRRTKAILEPKTHKMQILFASLFKIGVQNVNHLHGHMPGDAFSVVNCSVDKSCRKSDHSPNFQPMFVVAKRLDGLRCQLVRRYASVQATLCWIGTQSPPKKRAQPPIFGACLLWPYGCPSQLLLSTVELFIGYFTHPCSMIRLPMSWHWTLVYRVRFTHYWYTVVYCSTRSEKSHI